MKFVKMRLIQMKVILRYVFFLVIVKLFRLSTKDTWLISERGIDACDNGYAFFRYMKENHPEVSVKYVISKSSKDLQKFSSKEDLIYYRSNKHFLYFLTSKYLISSHVMGYSPEFRIMQKLDKKNLVFVKGKRIFLQHGITKDKITSLYKDSTKLNLFICGAKPEYDFISKEFGYDEEVIYTGFARYDYLENIEKRQILLMPTWREYLYHVSDEEFIKTKYYKEYQGIINNFDLIHLLEKYNYELVFYPHYEMQRFITHFSTSSDKVIIASLNEYSVPDLLKECSLLITDYSSVFFDVAYLKKPVVYNHFDYTEYRNSNYKTGYFSYEKNGFGPVVQQREDLIKEIEKYLNNNFQVEQCYVERQNKFFMYHDQKNCERIYQKISRL